MDVAFQSALPQYRFLREVAAGGMGQVYECRCRRSGRQVALKISVPLSSEPLREHCSKEAWIGAKVSSRFVPRLYDCGTFDDRIWIAMEFVEGKSLTELLAAGGLGVPERLRILRGVAEAVCEVHAQGVVHRDIKPANIMIRPDGRVCLVDFGISTWEGDPPAAIMGTPECTPPEVLKGMPSDRRVDLFQLGVLAYRLFGRRAPWSGKDPFEMAISICTAFRVPFLDVLTDAAQAYRHELERLEPIISKSLQADPDQRPMNAQAWVAAFDRVIADGVLSIDHPVWIDSVDLEGGRSLEYECRAA